MAWRHLFESMLGLPGGRRDPVSLLDWASDADGRNRLAHLDVSERSNLVNAVQDSAGELSRRIFDCAAGEFGANVLSIGLVARVLFGQGAEGDIETAKAAVRLEPFLDGQPLDDDLAASWADAAEAVIGRRLDRDGIAGVRPLLDEADTLLRDELLAKKSALKSSVLQLGFEQRIGRFAAELRSVVKGGASELPPSIQDAADQVHEHMLARYDGARCERLKMAQRLLGWLVNQRKAAETGLTSFAEAAAAYRRDGGFADWARAEVWDGDTNSALSSGYTDLSKAVDGERERFNQRFGSLFANWSSVGSHDESVISVEDFLERVATPLAKQLPILIAVIDGMGMAEFRELEHDLLDKGWIQLGLSGASAPHPVISAVPSVTEVSRTSLLSGKLRSGNQDDEAKAFPKHKGLFDSGSPSKPPRLFHKGGLTEPGRAGLSSTLADALTDPKQHVVGVVINAVDDHLTKGEQVRVHWGVDAIRPLDAVLSAAIEAGRIVIVVSDHGHISEHRTEMIPGGEAERWRHTHTEPSEPRAGELLIEGPRVVLGQDGKIIAPWSERIRFKPKKNGYHGGLSPQEVVIPLGVFSGGGPVPEGWTEIPPELPVWWYREEPLVESDGSSEPVIHAPARNPPKKVEGQHELFQTEPDVPVNVDLAGAAAPGWIEDLLASEAMKTQRQQAARTALPDERIRAVLKALDERGGKLTRAALANQVNVPTLRVGGILSALRRVLNLDGYPVLSIDEASNTVELNREMLYVQFGLKEKKTV